jgi:transcriptional regulator with XRE-family HTH domain
VDNGTFGKLLRQHRESAQLAQAELGQRAGFSEAYISKLERDDRPPPQRTAILLADSLQLISEERDTFLEAAKAAKEAHRASLEGKHPADRLKGLPRLPPLESPPIGRANEIREIMPLLEQTGRVVAIVGDPGIGKTTLAKEIAHRLFQNGRVVLFADVRERQASSREEIEILLWNSLLEREIPESQIETLNLIREALARYKVLLVLDNLESIVDFDGVLGYLSQVAPPATVLLTSRRHIPGKLGQNVLLGELQQRDGVSLFERIGARHGRHVETEEQKTIICGICGDGYLGGHPGAIEIAAALWRSWPLPEILRGLHKRAMDTLVDPLRSDTNRGIRLSIDLSYDLMAKESFDAWQLFPRLSVFKASFDLLAISSVCAAPEALPALDILVSRSLVRSERERFSVHSVVREYGLEKLGADRGYYESAAAHYYLSHASRYAEDFDALEIEKANLFAVMEWCENQEQALALQLLICLDLYLERRGYWEQRLRRAEKALQIAQRLRAPEAITRVCFILASAHNLRGDLTEAREYVARATSNATKTRNGVLIGKCHDLWAQITLGQKDLDQARKHARQAIDAQRKAKARFGLSLSYFHLATIERHANKLLEACLFAEKGLKLARDCGDAGLAYSALKLLVEMALELGDLDRAKRCVEGYQALVRTAEDARMQGRLSFLRAKVALAQGQWDVAHEHLLTALPLLERLGFPWEVQSIWLEVARNAEEHRGDPATAEIYYERFANFSLGLGNLQDAAFGFAWLGLMRECQGRAQEADQAYREEARLLKQCGVEETGVTLEQVMHNLSQLGESRAYHTSRVFGFAGRRDNLDPSDPSGCANDKQALTVTRQV